MLKIVASNAFKKDLKFAQKRGKNLEKLHSVINLLAHNEPLPAKYRDHLLTGRYTGFRECHISPDWLLVYRYEVDELHLYLFRTGSHADLF